VGKKIRDAEVNKYPFMIVVGEKEAESATLSVRQRVSGDLGTMKIEDFADLVIGEMEKELVK
jgi:threonyl-tRNA synthetase